MQSGSAERILMDQERSNSLGRQARDNSSLRRLSSTLSDRSHSHLDDDARSESVSEAGDIGDRALHSGSRRGENGSFHLSLDRASEHGMVVPVQEDMVPTHGSFSFDPERQNSLSPAQPVPANTTSPLSTDAILSTEEKKEDEQNLFLQRLEYASCLVHLAFFGILGALTRYLLQKLFGPGGAGATKDGTILYLDLPSNMVGSFLMGWFGVVFKSNIAGLSDQLAIGLSTGYLGSLTTFSGWNQKMLDLAAHDQWVFAVLGYLIGLFLAAYSIIFGVETAQGFRWLLQRHGGNCSSSRCAFLSKVNTVTRHLVVVIALVLMWGSLVAVSGTLEKRQFRNGGSGAQLWLGCLVAPLGVWVRWWLARFNGRGLGKAGLWKWVPFGTLAANVSAACMMAALATVNKVVNTQRSATVTGGIQFGLMGCLSTVSTFIAEFNAMRVSSQAWRAYVYALVTFVVSFGLGTLIYSVPVWTKGYN